MTAKGMIIMIKNTKKCAYTAALIIIVSMFIFSGTAFADFEDIEVLTEDIIEDTGVQDSDPGLMHDIDEVSQPEPAA